MLSCGTVKEVSLNVESGLPCVDDLDLCSLNELWLKFLVGEEGAESSETVSALDFINVDRSEYGNLSELLFSL